MGQNKKKNSKKGGGGRKHAPATAAAKSSGRFAALAERAEDGSGGSEPEEEEDMGNPEWLAEQRRLLEMYSSRSQGSAAGGSGEGGGAGSSATVRGSSSGGPPAESGGGAGSDDEEGDLAAKRSAVIERQRRLLEEAAASHQSADSSEGSPHYDGGGNGSSSSNALAATPAPVLVPPGPPPGRPPQVRNEVFVVRRISFRGRETPTLMQNRDGPCALLAVANGLLLRGTLQLEKDDVLVSAEALISKLAQLCWDLNANSVQKDANMQEGVAEVVARLPHLLDGLLLNCGFLSCTDFEATADLGLFDCLGMQLHHCWVDPEVHKRVRTYNALSEQLAVCNELRAELEQRGREPSPEEDERLAQGLWLEQWLEGHRGQATTQGLQELQPSVDLHQVCVLFRNNHFSTIYKPSTGSLCALLTDAAFEEEAGAVWESIELDGDAGHILGPEFGPMSAESTAVRPTGKDPAVREDLVAVVIGMGFSREQALAGLAATAGTSAEEAIEAILEAPGGMPAPKASVAGGRRGGNGANEVFSCPLCQKAFRTKNGMLDHRISKDH